LQKHESRQANKTSEWTVELGKKKKCAISAYGDENDHNLGNSASDNKSHQIIKPPSHQTIKPSSHFSSALQICIFYSNMVVECDFLSVIICML
jgi:hypothetical protein